MLGVISYFELLLFVGNIYIDRLVQHCSNSIANALELLQSCTQPWYFVQASTSEILWNE